MYAVYALTYTARVATRDDLLSAASRLVREGGQARLTMRGLALEVGLSPMAAYRHFPDRAELLDAVSQVGLRRLETALAARGEESSPRARVERLLEAYRDFALAEPHLFELLFLSHRRGPCRFPEDFVARASTFFVELQEDVEAAMGAGVFRADDPFETSLAVRALAHGLLSLRELGRFGEDPAPFRSLFDRSIRRFLDGLEDGGPAARAPPSQQSSSRAAHVDSADACGRRERDDRPVGRRRRALCGFWYACLSSIREGEIEGEEDMRARAAMSPPGVEQTTS